MTRTVVVGGTVVDGSGATPRRADVEVVDGVITRVGEVADRSGEVLDADGRLVLPGLIDAHSHADSAVLTPQVQEALLRQGVTTVVVGQDGVSYAPGDGSYAAEYFGALDGPHPTYRGGGVGALLAGYDGATAVNVGYLVPAGTVRHEVCGFDPAPATDSQVAAMRSLVADGMAQGALGLSTGLDYVPNIAQSTAELIELCRPVAAAGGVYVTHMRGGYESRADVGMDEVAAIGLSTGVPVHVSHYHGPSDLLLSLLDDLAARGVDVTFDSYPYRRGCTLLAMVLLPAALQAGPPDEVAARLREPAVRAELLERWLPQLELDPVVGPGWPDDLTLVHVGAGGPAWAQGLTVREGARRSGVTPGEFVVDLLVAARMQVSAVAKVRHQREYDEIARLFVHPGHVAGSDGIYVGAHPHPRGWATFSRFWQLMVHERGEWDPATAARHLSGRTAARHGLADRGLVRPGYVADLAVVDADGPRDAATYEHPTALSTGVGDVLVAGVPVLRDGRPTGLTPGAGLRRSGPAR